MSAGRSRVTEGRPHVLVVEDDAQLRRLVERVLAAHYEVTSVATAAGAVERARAVGADLDLLVLDRVLPDSAGPRLAATLRSLCPEARVLYVSGFSDGLAGLDAPILQKPFDPDELLDAVARALAPRSG